MTSNTDKCGRGEGRPVELQGSTFFDFVSRLNNRTYRLFVRIPEGVPPANGFPVLYLFDGNLNFSMAAEVARGLSLAGEVHPAIVVGIGYPTDDLMAAMVSRFTDLSIAASQTWIDGLSAKIPGLTESITGGVDDFLRVLEDDIKPMIAELAPVNVAHQTLLGHSLGGLAVLRALFTRPTSFRSFVASSPSIWWADRQILAGEAQFASAVTRGTAQPRVLIAAGGLERFPRRPELPYFKSEADAFNTAASVRMIDNATDLASRLASISGGPNYHVSSFVFDEESHASVLPAVICRGIQFGLGIEGVFLRQPSGAG
jgi:predicted alpha/beta superfamily hydrolase